MRGQIREKGEERANLARQLHMMQQQLEEMEQRLTNYQEQLQERVNLARQLDVMQQQVRKMEQRLTNYQEQLDERDSREVSLHEQLREKEQQQENSQRQLIEIEQQLTTCEGQIREKDEERANLAKQLDVMQQQLGEMEHRLTNYQEQLQERDLKEADLHEQLREKEQQEENSQRQLTEMEQRLTNYQEQEEERDLREASLHEQLREKERQQEISQRQQTEMERQLINCEGEKANIQQRVSTLEGQLRVKEQEVNELELSLTAAQQTLTQQRQQETWDWVISRHEIQMTDKCLGRGGWAIVYEGTYCGCSVAVKQIHELILSRHNRRLFEREMNIASRCRHPCLLQFIGATNDEGTPLFVTELMETTLRALLEERGLSEKEVSVVALDVSLALNYLHQKKPSPIIHRDVSSANVLLWRQGDQWRGKLSDYGTAKFLQQTMTVAPGAFIYSAPEALSSHQTAMVDVYSFGVLLCEMCIRELPCPDRREEQVLLVTNRVFRSLVRRCLQTDPAQRPNMEAIIQELKQ